MESILDYEEILAQLIQSISLNWAGKKQLDEDDQEIIKVFAVEYAKKIIDIDFVNIVLTTIYKKIGSSQEETYLRNLLDEITKQHPLLLQGMGGYGEAPLIFARDLLLLTINESLNNEIAEDEDNQKLLAIGSCISFIEFYNQHPKSGYNNITNSFKEILNVYYENAIDRLWSSENVYNKQTLSKQSTFKNINFDESNLTPVEPNYINIIYNNSVHIYNSYNTLVKEYNDFKKFTSKYMDSLKINNDLLWWLNIKHSPNYSGKEFFSYKLLSNSFIAGALMGYDLVNISSVSTPIPNKVKALLLECLYSCFPNTLSEDTTSYISLNELNSQDFEFIPNIEMNRDTLKMLENFIDINIPLSSTDFALQVLLLNEYEDLIR